MTFEVKGLGDVSTVIRLTRADCLIGLTRDEASLVKSLGTGRRISQVIEGSDLPPPVVIGLLASLYERSVITKVQQRPTPETEMPQKGRSAAPLISPGAATRIEKPIDSFALDEPCDLDQETRRILLEMEARLDSTDLFFVLGLPDATEPATVKRHYYELCRRFHPDRFTGKSMGSFHKRIEKIFARLSEAQLILTHPERRTDYLTRFPELAQPVARASDMERARSDERRQRLRRHPFMLQKLHRAQLIDDGREAFLRGDFLMATLDLEAAEKMGALDPESARWLQEARLKTSRKQR